MSDKKDIKTELLDIRFAALAGHVPDGRYYTDLVCTCGSFYPCRVVREWLAR